MSNVFGADHLRPREDAPRARPRTAHSDPHPLCRPFTDNELRVVLANLKKRKAPGIDSICAEMLQQLGSLGRERLLCIENPLRKLVRLESPPTRARCVLTA